MPERDQCHSIPHGIGKRETGGGDVITIAVITVTTGVVATVATVATVAIVAIVAIITVATQIVLREPRVNPAAIPLGDHKLRQALQQHLKGICTIQRGRFYSLRHLASSSPLRTELGPSVLGRTPVVVV